jgi:hypothetical protein
MYVSCLIGPNATWGFKNSDKVKPEPRVDPLHENIGNGLVMKGEEGGRGALKNGKSVYLVPRSWERVWRNHCLLIHHASDAIHPKVKEIMCLEAMRLRMKIQSHVSTQRASEAQPAKRDVLTWVSRRT